MKKLAFLAVAALALVTLSTSCKGRTNDNVEGNNETIEVVGGQEEVVDTATGEATVGQVVDMPTSGTDTTVIAASAQEVVEQPVNNK